MTLKTVLSEKRPLWPASRPLYARNRARFSRFLQTLRVGALRSVLLFLAAPRSRRVRPLLTTEDKSIANLLHRLLPTDGRNHGCYPYAPQLYRKITCLQTVKGLFRMLWWVFLGKLRYQAPWVVFSEFTLQVVNVISIADWQLLFSDKKTRMHAYCVFLPFFMYFSSMKQTVEVENWVLGLISNLHSK